MDYYYPPYLLLWEPNLSENNINIINNVLKFFEINGLGIISQCDVQKFASKFILGIMENPSKFLLDQQKIFQKEKDKLTDELNTLRKENKDLLIEVRNNIYLADKAAKKARDDLYSREREMKNDYTLQLEKSKKELEKVKRDGTLELKDINKELEELKRESLSKELILRSAITMDIERRMEDERQFYRNQIDYFRGMVFGIQKALDSNWEKKHP